MRVFSGKKVWELKSNYQNIMSIDSLNYFGFNKKICYVFTFDKSTIKWGLKWSYLINFGWDVLCNHKTMVINFKDDISVMNYKKYDDESILVCYDT